MRPRIVLFLVLLAPIQICAGKTLVALQAEAEASFTWEDVVDEADDEEVSLTGFFTTIAMSLDNLLEDIKQSEFVKDRLTPAAEEVWAKIKNFEYEDAWDKFVSLGKDFVNNIVEGAKARVDLFSERFEKLMEDSVDSESVEESPSGIVDQFEDDDYADVFAIIEAHADEEGVDEEDDADQLMISAHAKIQLQLDEDKVSSGNRRLMKAGAARRLSQDLSAEEKEEIMNIMYRQRASAELEVLSTNVPSSQAAKIRKAKRKCKKGKLKERHNALAKEIYDIVKDELPSKWQDRAAEAFPDAKAACAEGGRKRRAVIKTLQRGQAHDVFVTQRGSQGKKVYGGYLDFNLEAGATFESVDTPDFRGELAKEIAASIDSEVEASMIFVQMQEVCRAVERPKPKKSYNNDGRRRAPKRGDGRRRRRTKKARKRDKNKDGRRRRQRRTVCQCQCACCGGGRRRHDRRLAWQNMSNPCEVDCGDADSSSDVWMLPAGVARSASAFLSKQAVPKRRLDDDDDGDDGDGKKHKRTKTKWINTCDSRYKGKVAVKTYFEIRIPAIREPEEKRIKAKVKMNTHFKAKVKTKAEANTKVKAKLRMHASANLEVKSETEYKDRPRPSKTKLKASFSTDFNAVVGAHKDLREQFMKTANDFKSKAITSYTDYKDRFEASISHFRESSVSSGSSIRFKAEGKIDVKVKAINDKVTSGEDLTESESRVMARVSAAASMDVDFKRKVQQSDEAREFEVLRAKVEQRRKKVAEAAVEFSADFRARLQATFDMQSELKTQAEVDADNAVMDKMVQGEDLTESELELNVEANLKAGAEIKVAQEDKMRMDFAAEASARMSLSVLAEEEKEEVMLAFDAAAKTKIHMCTSAKLVTHSCSSDECWAITSEFRKKTDATNYYCQTSCRGGSGLSVACQKNTKLADKICKCCGEEDENTLVLEDECADLNAAWELVLDGDFEALNPQQENIVRKVLREGKAWANKKYLSFSNAVAKKYVDAEEYVLNLIDWQELEISVKEAISEALDWVKENKDRLHQYFSKEEFAAIDATKEKATCECEEELGQGEVRMVRVSLDLRAKAELTTASSDGSDDGISHKKVTTKMKIKVKGEAAAERLQSAEAKAAIRSTFGAYMGDECSMCEVEEADVRRRLVACETGRCLEAEVDFDVSQTTDKIDALGDVDEATQQVLEAPDETAVGEDMTEKLQQVGAIDDGDSVDVTIDQPETEETDKIPSEPEFIAGTPESNVNAAVVLGATPSFTLVIMAWIQSMC